MSLLQGGAGEMLSNTGMPGRILVIRSGNRNLVSCLRTLRMFVRCDIPAISLMEARMPLLIRWRSLLLQFDAAATPGRQRRPVLEGSCGDAPGARDLQPPRGPDAGIRGPVARRVAVP